MAGKIEQIVELPQGVNAEIKGLEVKMSGKTSTSRTFKAANVELTKSGNSIKICGNNDMKITKAIVLAISAHLKNMIRGVQEGHESKLAIVYSHFPLNVQVKGTTIDINNFLGEKRPRIAKIVGSTKVEIKGKEIFVRGPDIEAVGQTAANMEQATKVRGKDRRIFQDGIFLVEK